VKKRVLTILNAKKEQVRQDAYRDLLVYAGKVREYALVAIQNCRLIKVTPYKIFLPARSWRRNWREPSASWRRSSARPTGGSSKGKRSLPLRRWSPSSRTTPTSSSRSDGKRSTATRSFSRADLHHDSRLPDRAGNPADTEKYSPLLHRQKDLYGRMPLKVSADGGFASKDNLTFAKKHGVKDAVFAKKRGLSVLAMARVRGYTGRCATSGPVSRRAFPPSRRAFVWTVARGRDGRIRSVCLEFDRLLQPPGAGQNKTGSGITRWRGTLSAGPRGQCALNCKRTGQKLGSTVP